MYACQQCHKKYTYARGVKQHMKYECNKDKQFQCNVCFKRYTRKNTLKYHTIVEHTLKK
nr:unnamed protein product [Callosobruchus analis]